MKTGKIVGLTVAAVLGLVLLICDPAMWSHMKTQAATGHGHHAAQVTSVAKP